MKSRAIASTIRTTLGIGALLFAGRAALAQGGGLSGYYQNVAIGMAAGPGNNAGALDAQRARVMWTPAAGACALNVAYEHTFWWRDSPGTGAQAGLLSSTRAGGDWLHLGWTIHQGSRISWQQRFDRLGVACSRGAITATVGRQAVSWATTLLLTPADPFVPFDPSDPFREYRTGVDAARVQWFAGPFTTVDVVVRPATTPVGRTITAAARVSTQVARWELSAWAGAIHNQPGGAVGVTRTVAGSAIRAESELRRDTSGGVVARTAVGVDRRFTVVGRDLYAVLEYQHDPFGAADAAGLIQAATSAPAARREMQVFGRDEAALDMTWQAHPLVSLELMSLVNLRDGSALFAPAASISASNNASLRAGVDVPLGRGKGIAGPASEYGPVPVTGYAAISIFF
ncbi:MAG TPA: hypothetical protein VFK16_04805 [Gemmatimonadaceae bacterium]|nr:hypothetical protein [Gemmatimonadaceae bacterium]